jgi:hypothetical protein
LSEESQIFIICVVIDILISRVVECNEDIEKNDLVIYVSLKGYTVVEDWAKNKNIP